MKIVAEVNGQGLLDMDLTFFAYLRSVMQRVDHAADDDVTRTIKGHAERLADQDPDRAMDYRTQMHASAARTWPAEASHDLRLEWSKQWAPTPASDDYWRKLPSRVRESYTRQGALMFKATLAAMSAEA